MAEYAKATPNDVLCKITVTNRGLETANVHVLPTLWYRNSWIWGCQHEGCTMKPKIARATMNSVDCTHQTLEKFRFAWGVDQASKDPELWFTENETNSKELFDTDNYTTYVKDAFHRYLIGGEKDAINPKHRGTKVAAHYNLTLDPGESYVIKCRLTIADEKLTNGIFNKKNFDDVFETRKKEADNFYCQVLPAKATKEENLVSRQAYAGLLWSKQFYHYIVKDWIEGDPDQPKPPSSRTRNSDWHHLFNRDVLSMPDKWEYPWLGSTTSNCDHCRSASKI
eukprot:gene14391-15890_t